MAKDWDASLKLLISDSPEDFASWIFEEAQIQVREKLSTEFTGQKLEADALLDIVLDGVEALLQIEFQAERLLEYNLRARREHKRPVYSCSIYVNLVSIWQRQYRRSGVARKEFQDARYIEGYTNLSGND